METFPPIISVGLFPRPVFNFFYKSMATEKILIFDEAGNAKRMKVRIARFLDSEPVTGADKENIRDSLGVSPDATGLVRDDIGSGAGEIPVNGMLGGLAYQDADSVSVDTLEVTDKVTGNLTVNPGDLTITGDTSDAYTAGTLKLIAGNLGTNSIQLGDVSNDDIGKIEYKNSDNSLRFTTNATEAVTINSSQNVGIGADSGSTKMRVSGGSGQLFKIDDGANPLLVCDATGEVGIGTSSPQSKLHVFNSTADNLRLERDATNDWRIQLTSGSLAFRDATADAERWRIDSSGNLVANSTGIDFSSTGDGSGSGQAEILDDFETGEWVPVFAPSGGSFTAQTMNVVAARYVKVGHQVTVNCYIQTTNLDTSGASGQVMVTGLPYANAGSNNFVAAHIGYAIDWTEAPSGGYINQSSTQIVLNKRYTGITGSLSPMDVNGLNTASGAKNTIMLTATYNSF